MKWCVSSERRSARVINLVASLASSLKWVRCTSDYVHDYWDRMIAACRAFVFSRQKQMLAAYQRRNKYLYHSSVHSYTVRVHRDTFYPQPCLFSFAHVSWTRRHEERAFNGSPPCVYENLFQSKTKCFFTQESAELTAQFAFDSHPVETANRAAARRHFSGNRKKKLARIRSTAVWK